MSVFRIELFTPSEIELILSGMPEPNIVKVKPLFSREADPKSLASPVDESMDLASQLLAQFSTHTLMLDKESVIAKYKTFYDARAYLDAHSIDAHGIPDIYHGAVRIMEVMWSLYEGRLDLRLKPTDVKIIGVYNAGLFTDIKQVPELYHLTNMSSDGTLRYIGHVHNSMVLHIFSKPLNLNDRIHKSL